VERRRGEKGRGAQHPCLLDEQAHGSREGVIGDELAREWKSKGKNENEHLDAIFSTNPGPTALLDPRPSVRGRGESQRRSHLP
jgi:hypothetical protein